MRGPSDNRTDDRNFLAHERLDHRLRDADDDRLARLIPAGPRANPRERVASVLIALALRIAPSMDHARLGAPIR